MSVQKYGLGFREFFRAYIECALWSSYDYNEDGDMLEPLDELVGVFEGNITLSAYRVLYKNCAEFWVNNIDDILALEYNHPEHSDFSLAGHDLWLTENGHGAGFWDRGLGELGEKLTEACQYNSTHLERYEGKLYAYN